MNGQPEWDAVVVGAGPAGSVAALVLARGGARVALVDKAEFPREKACGDLVGPRGVRLLEDMGVRVPDFGRGSDLLVVGPSGRRVVLPAFPGRAYADHGVIVPRIVFDDALRSQAIAAGAVAVTARIVGAERNADGSVNHLTAGDGRTLRGRVVMAADGALSPIAHLTGMVDGDTALWGFAIRGYLNAEVPLPLLALLDVEPRRIFPGYGWLFPGADGRANIGIGLALRRRERPATALRQDLARLCARLEASHDLPPNSHVEAITGGWLRMGGVGSRPASTNVLLVGDAAGLVNPLQGEGIAQAMISGRLAGEAVLADPARAADAYAAVLAETFTPFMGGASAIHVAMLQRAGMTSTTARVLTTPGIRRVVAGTWALYLNGLADGAAPRPSAWTAKLIQQVAGRFAAA